LDCVQASLFECDNKYESKHPKKIGALTE